MLASRPSHRYDKFAAKTGTSTEFERSLGTVASLIADWNRFRFDVLRDFEKDILKRANADFKNLEKALRLWDGLEKKVPPREKVPSYDDVLTGVIVLNEGVTFAKGIESKCKSAKFADPNTQIKVTIGVRRFVVDLSAEHRALEKVKADESKLYNKFSASNVDLTFAWYQKNKILLERLKADGLDKALKDWDSVSKLVPPVKAPPRNKAELDRASLQGIRDAYQKAQTALEQIADSARKAAVSRFGNSTKEETHPALHKLTALATAAIKPLKTALSEIVNAIRMLDTQLTTKVDKNFPNLLQEARFNTRKGLNVGLIPFEVNAVVMHAKTKPPAELFKELPPKIKTIVKQATVEIAKDFKHGYVKFTEELAKPDYQKQAAQKAFDDWVGTIKTGTEQLQGKLDKEAKKFVEDKLISRCTMKVVCQVPKFTVKLPNRPPGEELEESLSRDLKKIGASAADLKKVQNRFQRYQQNIPVVTGKLSKHYKNQTQDNRWTKELDQFNKELALDLDSYDKSIVLLEKIFKTLEETFKKCVKNMETQKKKMEDGLVELDSKDIEDEVTKRTKGIVELKNQLNRATTADGKKIIEIKKRLNGNKDLNKKKVESNEFNLTEGLLKELVEFGENLSNFETS